MMAKGELCDWVMWPNKNFGVFEVEWGLGYDLWVIGFEFEFLVMSIELWKLSHGQTKQALSIPKRVNMEVNTNRSIHGACQEIVVIELKWYQTRVPKTERES